MELSQEILDQIGAENQADLTAKLKLAYEKGAAIENINAIALAVKEQSEVTQKALTAHLEAKTQEIEAEKYEEFAKSNLVETFNALPDDNDQKAAIREQFEKALGHSDAAVALEGDSLTKALQAPISKSNPKYEDTMALRKAFDYAILYCAATEGGLTFKNVGSTERMNIDRGTLRHAVDVLKGHNVEGVEMLEKAIDVALDTQTAAEGFEWVPAQILSRNLYQDVWLAQQIAGNFQRFASPGPNFSVPIRTGRARMFGVDEAKLVTDFYTNKVRASNLATDKVDFVARKAGVVCFTSDELQDDSVIPILDALYDELRFASAEGIEQAVLNGSRAVNDLDNAGTDTNRLWANTADQGDGIRENTGLADARYLWNGIRKRALAGTAKATSSSFARAELLALRALMGKYGVRPEDLFLVVAPETYIKMLGWDEVATLEKYGAQATVLKGELARIDNIPIIVSSAVRTDYDNLGTFTNGTVVGGSSGVENLTQLTMVHRRGYAFADRMSMRVESQREMLAGQQAVLGTMRLDFKPMFASGETTEAVLNAVPR